MRGFGSICIRVAAHGGRKWYNRYLQINQGYPSGQRGQTVNLLVYTFGGSNPSPWTLSSSYHSHTDFLSDFLFPLLSYGYMNNSPNRKPPLDQVTPQEQDERLEEEVLEDIHSEADISSDTQRSAGYEKETPSPPDAINGTADQQNEAPVEAGGDIYDPDKTFDADAENMSAGTPGHPGIDDTTG